MYRVFADEGLTFSPSNGTIHALSSIAVVNEGLANAIVPEGLLILLNLENVMVLSVPHLGMGRDIAIASAEDRTLPPVVRAFNEVVKDRTCQEGQGQW
jgi:DNA-binding transcriptional LysR family regulator